MVVEFIKDPSSRSGVAFIGCGRVRVPGRETAHCDGYGPNCGLLTLWGVTVSTESPAEGSRITSPFHDLADFAAIPRVTALRLSPDGSWLAAAVQTLSADRKKYLTSLWRIDTGGGPPRRLTRSAEGEASPRFLPDGSLLFTSRRPDPGADKSGKDGPPADVAALWLL